MLQDGDLSYLLITTWCQSIQSKQGGPDSEMFFPIQFYIKKRSSITPVAKNLNHFAHKWKRVGSAESLLSYQSGNTEHQAGLGWVLQGKAGANSFLVEYLVSQKWGWEWGRGETLLRTKSAK